MNEIGHKIMDKLIELHGSKDFIIAFLPYKRSMWNSMASVYEECKKSGIDAHCYPIPYYRMKEGKQVDYIDSDFEFFGEIAEDINMLDHADFVAIHYFYDGQNRVTSMLPEYYTGALKQKYKCKVVLLPYGIRYSNNQGTAFYDGIKEVDYIFGSDDNMDEFIRQWKTRGVDFSGRVFSLGTPKYDMARSLTKEVPEEWQSIIGNKSVTLILNSLGVYLTNPFDCIMSYKQYAIEEVGKGHIVIFRPHPLLRTTINSMRSGTRSQFDRLMRELGKMENVIIDESEYLERAMACADYLISDPSSVVKMWEVTGKPYMLMREL